MRELTYPELDLACASTIRPVNGYQNDLVLLMELYYMTGIRPIEGVESDRWSISLTGQIKLITAKTAQVRTFDPLELPLEFVEAIYGDRWPFMTIRISQAQQFFNKVFPYPTMFKGDKATNMYAFRYRYVKWLQRSGFPPSQIQYKMGWVDPQLVFRYAGARLFV